MQEKIRKFIVKGSLAGEDNPGFKNEDSFLETRIIDSIGVLELGQFIEETWGIRAEDADLTPENFDSVELAVLDQEGRPVPPNVTGEVVASAENIMKGYWIDPEQPPESSTPGGASGLRTWPGSTTTASTSSWAARRT